MTTAETYVTAAFLVFLAIILAWLVIYAFKMRRLQQEVSELAARPQAAAEESPAAPRVVPAHGDDSGPEQEARRAPEPVR